MRKRKLNEKELRLMVERRRRNGKTVTVHVGRCVRRGLIIACSGKGIVGNAMVANWDIYPFYRFMWDAAPLCQECTRAIGNDGPFPPVSNTGVENPKGDSGYND